MADETAAPDLDAMAREVLDGIRYMVLGTVDPDGRPRTSPVYFTPHRYQDLYWVSHPDTHHTRNLERDDRLAVVVFDSTVPPIETRAVYAEGRAREVPEAELAEHLPVAFDPDRRGGRRFTPEELVDSADVRLWVLHVDSWEVHIGANHPTLGTGRDRRVLVDPQR
jgi:nitroimidazol reductase NimA-like FMN-containing flavoprotein (pyridoxamine 5'-phosphate oxidase superfamily)